MQYLIRSLVQPTDEDKEITAMRQRTRSNLLTISMLLALSAAASAQPHEPPPPPLGGPPVHDRDVPGAGNTFGEGMPGEKGKATPRIAPRLFFEALRSLDSEDAPPELRPSPGQRDELRAIAEDFRDEVRAFRRQHQDAGDAPPRRERAPRPPRGPRGEGNADAPPPPPPPDGDQMPPPPPREGERRGPRGEDRRGPDAPPPPPPHDNQRPGDRRPGPEARRGPNPDGYYARVWELLDPGQQDYLRAQIDEAQRERMMQREEPIVREGVRRKLAEQQGEQRRRRRGPDSPPAE